MSHMFKIGLVIFGFSISTTHASNFDGWSFPADGCTGSAMPIQNSEYDTCESLCRMKNPVSVSGMDATLYEVMCKGDWGSSKDRKFFIHIKNQPNNARAVVVSNYGIVELERSK